MNARPWTRFYATNTPFDLPPLPENHLARFARAHAALHGSRPSFSTVLPGGQTGTLSFAQLDAQSDAFAAFLREDLGLQAGDRVALQLPNCLAYPIAAFGVFKAGLVLVNTNPLYTPTEMAYQFKDSGAKALVILDLFADKLESALPGTNVAHVVTASLTEGFPALSGALVRFVLKHVQHRVPTCRHPHRAFNTVLALGHARLAQGLDPKTYTSNLGPDALACLQYTGGTTGVSKGTMLSHGNLLSNVEQAWLFCRHRIIPEQEVVLAPLPLYH
ncbi:MAG: AMP-binding protein, partial [bacterium]